MADDGGEDKSHPASAKRKQDLRNEGQVPKSQDISSTAMLVTGWVMVLVLVGMFAEALAGYMRDSFMGVGEGYYRATAVRQLSGLISKDLLIPFCIFMATIFMVAIVVNLSQVGLQFTFKPLEPKLDRLNPVNGVKKLFSMQKVVMAATGVAKFGLIGGFVYWAFQTLSGSPVFQRMVNASEYGEFLFSAIWEIGWRVMLALIILAGLDYAYQKYKFEKDNRMSSKEIKDEFKQMEGSPEIKKKIRQKGLQISLKRMMENMADSTIVVTNPTHYAVALKYKRGETPAPVIMAKGTRLIAQKIKGKAMEYRIPIMENKQLARGLYKHGKVGEAIPVLYFQAVATLLAQLQRQGYRVLDEAES